MGILQARIQEWVAMPSSRGSSHPRDQTQVSRTAGGFFTVWATREAPGGPVVKNRQSMQETQQTQVQSLGQEDTLEEEMATHSNILAWKIPWAEEPDGLQSMGLQGVGHDWASIHTYRASERLGFRSWLSPLSAKWCWASDLTLLSLSFFIFTGLLGASVTRCRT